MSDESTPILATLDAAIASVGFPVREDSVEQAWNVTVESQPSAGFHERVRRAIGQALPAGELLLLVTLHTRRGDERALAAAAEVFVGATRQLPGVLGSTLYQSAADPLTLTLVEQVRREARARGTHGGRVFPAISTHPGPTPGRTGPSCVL